MNVISSRRFLVILTIMNVIFGVVQANENLTPEQLFMLMKASREQYDTISSKLTAISYRYDANDHSKKKVASTSEILSRWTRKSSFSRIVETLYDENNTPIKTITSTYAIMPRLAKRLVETSGEPILRGFVSDMPLELEQEQTFYTIYTAMWNVSRWSWEKWNLDEATLILDEKNNYYVIKVKMGSKPKVPFLILYVDPSKSFIPVKSEFLKYDGTLVAKYECSDFRQTESGLWIPYQYSWFNPSLNYGGIYTAKEVVVNEPFAENLLDFEFPVGTIVYNEILNLRYKIEDVNHPQSFVVDPCSETLTDVLSTPVEEEALLTAASKAKELLEAQTSTEAKTSQIVVSPLTVLVTIEKYEYKLSVNRTSGTKPVLLNYKFESTKLVLSSLKNLINTDDFLIVNINRLESHTGFASGTLFLYFEAEDNPVKITFVSAPLSNLS